MAHGIHVITQAIKGSMTSIMLYAKDGNASRKIDILAEFEDTATNREIVVCRAMYCKAP